VSWAEPAKKLSARVVEKLYAEGDSPLRYKINRLGGRSKQEKWILQAELFNEIHRWVSGERKLDASVHAAKKRYEILRDFLKASEKVWGDVWGSSGHMVTRPVTIKAMLRVAFDLAAVDADPADGRVQRWTKRLAPWSELNREFRTEGFYERFPAKGQVERVARIHRELARVAKVELSKRSKKDAE
jgi:hypothetical protein